MAAPFCIDIQGTRATDVLAGLLAHCCGCPVDIASAYFSISGWKLLKDGLHSAGALRLILGSEPEDEADLGLNASQQLLTELNALAFSEDTVRLVEKMYLAVCRSGAESGLWPGEKYLGNADKTINHPQQSTKYGTILFICR